MAAADGQGIQIVDGGLTHIGDRINTAQAEFKKLSAMLSSQLEHMPQKWQGAGGIAFGKLHVEWQTRQAEITKALQLFEDSLSSTQKDASVNDETQSGSMFQINKNLEQV